eukprot:176321_1
MNYYREMVLPYVTTDPILLKDAKDSVKFDCLRTFRPRVVWIGEFVSDLWLYLRNNHILLGIFLKDINHPLGRLARVVILYCSMCASLAVSVIFDSPSVSDKTTAALALSVVFYIYFIRFFGTWGKGRMFRRIRGMGCCCRCCGRVGLLFGVACSTCLLLIGVIVAVLVRFGSSRQDTSPPPSLTLAPTGTISPTSTVISQGTSVSLEYMSLQQSRWSHGPYLLQVSTPTSTKAPRSDRDDIIISFAISQVSSWIQSSVILSILYTILRYFELREVRRLHSGDDISEVRAFWLSRNEHLTQRLEKAKEFELNNPPPNVEIVAVINGEMVRIMTSAGTSDGPSDEPSDGSSIGSSDGPSDELSDGSSTWSSDEPSDEPSIESSVESSNRSPNRSSEESSNGSSNGSSKESSEESSNGSSKAIEAIGESMPDVSPLEYSSEE